jgi:hypothetical protein
MSTVPALVRREGDRGSLSARQVPGAPASARSTGAGIAMMAADGMSNRQIAKVGIDLTQGLFR